MNLKLVPNVTSKQMNLGDIIELKLTATADLTVGAMSFIIDYPKLSVSIVDIVLPVGTKLFNSTDLDGNLRIAWYSLVPAELKAGIMFGKIIVKVIEQILPGQPIELSVTDHPECNFGDANAQLIPNVEIAIDMPVQIAAVKMLVREKKAAQEYISPFPRLTCKNCNHYNLETRRCGVGGFIVSRYAKCTLYT